MILSIGIILFFLTSRLIICHLFSSENIRVWWELHSTSHLKILFKKRKEKEKLIYQIVLWPSPSHVDWLSSVVMEILLLFFLVEKNHNNLHKLSRKFTVGGLEHIFSIFILFWGGSKELRPQRPVRRTSSGDKTISHPPPMHATG